MLGKSKSLNHKPMSYSFLIWVHIEYSAILFLFMLREKMSQYINTQGWLHGHTPHISLNAQLCHLATFHAYWTRDPPAHFTLCFSNDGAGPVIKCPDLFLRQTESWIWMKYWNRLPQWEWDHSGFLQCLFIFTEHSILGKSQFFQANGSWDPSSHWLLFLTMYLKSSVCSKWHERQK